jgi:hypothetical protein
MHTRFAIAMSTALVLCGCEHGITLRGTVTVPPAVQSAYSAQNRGVVYLQADIPKTGLVSYRLATLCDPKPEPLVLDYFEDRFGCAKEGPLTAWVTPVAADDAHTCGGAPEHSPGNGRDQATAFATAPVFRGNTGELGCSSGSETVDLVLKPGKPSQLPRR